MRVFICIILLLVNFNSYANINNISSVLEVLKPFDGYVKVEQDPNNNCGNGIARNSIHHDYLGLGDVYKGFYIKDECLYRSVYIDKDSVLIVDDVSDALGIKTDYIIIDFVENDINEIMKKINLSHQIPFPNSPPKNYSIVALNVFGGIPESDTGAGSRISTDYYQFDSTYNYHLISDIKHSHFQGMSGLSYLFKSEIDTEKGSGYLAKISYRFLP